MRKLMLIAFTALTLGIGAWLQLKVSPVEKEAVHNHAGSEKLLAIPSASSTQADDRDRVNISSKGRNEPSPEELKQLIAGAVRAATVPIPAGRKANDVFNEYFEKSDRDLNAANKAAHIWQFCHSTKTNPKANTDASLHPASTGCDEFDVSDRTVIVDLTELAARIGGAREALRAAVTPPDVSGNPGSKNDAWFARNVARLENLAAGNNVDAMLALSQLYGRRFTGTPDLNISNYWLSKAVASMPIGPKRAKYQILLSTRGHS